MHFNDDILVLVLVCWNFKLYDSFFRTSNHMQDESNGNDGKDFPLEPLNCLNYFTFKLQQHIPNFYFETRRKMNWIEDWDEENKKSYKRMKNFYDGKRFLWAKILVFFNVFMSCIFEANADNSKDSEYMIKLHSLLTNKNQSN
jgi:hypothetical protein